MQLYHKIPLILLCVIGCFLAPGYLVVKQLIQPAFERLEISEASSNRARAEGAIGKELAQLRGITGDWAPWDDTYRFAQGLDRDTFIEDNLNLESVLVFDIDLMLFFDKQQRLVWGVRIDTETEQATPLSSNPFPQSMSARLLAFATVTDSAEGFADTAFGPAIVSSRPIVTSRRTGPIVGTFVVGKLLSEARVGVLRQRTAVDMRLRPVSADTSLGGDSATAVRLAGQPSVVEVGPNRRTERMLLRGLADTPLMLLEVVTPRSITALGESTLRTTLIWLALLAMIVVAVLWVVLRDLVIDPLDRLTRHITEVERTEDLTRRVNMNRNDEIGILAAGFDALFEQLHSARQLSLDQSYRAGMAEVAAGVLHNIRNTMTPLVNALDGTAQSVDDVLDPNIDRAIDELDADDTDLARKGKLLRYLRLATVRTADSVTQIREKLALAVDQARQIEHILHDQEQYTHARPVMEKVSVGEVIEKAISSVLADTGQDQLTIRLAPGLDDLFVITHRIGLLQVLGNLFLNASESIARHARPDGEIHVEAEVVNETSTLEIVIRVHDNGAGIAADRLQKVFARGVSSKDTGRGGLGLHWCANALDQLDGRIVAASDGPGRGATFSIYLPAAANEMAA